MRTEIFKRISFSLFRITNINRDRKQRASESSGCRVGWRSFQRMRSIEDYGARERMVFTLFLPGTFFLLLLPFVSLVASGRKTLSALFLSSIGIKSLHP